MLVPYKNLGDYLKDKRVKKGLTQKEVSDELGYTSAQFISNFERGLAAPPLDAIAKLVDLYDLAADDIINEILDQQEIYLREALEFSNKKRKSGKRA